MSYLNDKPGLFGSIRARPVRVAYILDPKADDAHACIDATRNHALGIWAGRYSPIIAIEDGDINKRYWGWLQKFDPDLIFSFVEISQSLRERIIYQLDPAELVIADQKERAAGRAYPRFRTSVLSSLSLIQNPPKTSFGDVPAIRLFGTWNFDVSSSGIADSFGDYAQTFQRNPLPTAGLAVKEVATLATPPDRHSEHWLRRRPDVIIESIDAAWQRLLENPMMGLTQITALNTPRFELRERDISSYFQVIIGDEPTDRLAFWNIAQFFPPWREATLQALRLSVADLENDDIIKSLHGYLDKHNWIAQDGRSGSNVAVRSTSLSEEEIEAAAERLRGEKINSFVRAYSPNAAIEAAPTKQELRYYDFDVPSMGLQRSGWDEFYWDGGLALPPSCYPRHLIGHLGDDRFKGGHWAVEIDLSRKDDHSKYANTRHVWRFSRRLRMSDAIGVKKSSADIYRRVLSDKRRINRYGMVTAFSSSENAVSEVSIPPEAQLFWHALVRDTCRVESRDGKELNLSPFSRLERSDKGDYLEGLLGFAGGLDSAIGFLLHEFWANQLQRWGATSKVSPTAVKPVLARLKKKFGANNEPISGHLETIAHTAVRYARTYRSPSITLSFSSLDEKWKAYRKSFWEKAKQDGEVVGESSEDEAREWDEREQKSLMRMIQELVADEVLYQGVSITCANCKHKNWLGVDEFSSDPTCSVCQSDIALPLDLDWEFRLNEFVLQCVRDHGIQALIWALSICRDRSSVSFFFQGPTNVWTDLEDNSTSDTDLDLTAVIDGQSYLIEVKSSLSKLGEKALSKFADVIRRVQPECAVLAIMDETTPKRSHALKEEFEKRLSDMQTSIEIWTLNEFPLHDGPYL